MFKLVGVSEGRMFSIHAPENFKIEYKLGEPAAIPTLLKKNNRYPYVFDNFNFAKTFAREEADRSEKSFRYADHVFSGFDSFVILEVDVEDKAELQLPLFKVSLSGETILGQEMDVPPHSLSFKTVIPRKVLWEQRFIHVE